MDRRRFLSHCTRLTFGATFSPFLWAIKPPLQHGITLKNLDHNPLNLYDFLASEKLDGVRAYWDGSQLISRQGNVFDAPDWFIRRLPEQPLDGELWLGRNRFDELSGIVRRKNDHKAWRDVIYMVFDLPSSSSPFSVRLEKLKHIIADTNLRSVELVNYFEPDSLGELTSRLENPNNHIEGYMLRRKDSLYQIGRTDDWLKVKLYQDDEALVLQHLPGKGQFEHKLGAILVKNSTGKQFRIGTGFSHEERDNPPPVGAIITYKYYGLTHNGTPRFASYLRQKDLRF